MATKLRKAVGSETQPTERVRVTYAGLRPADGPRVVVMEPTGRDVGGTEAVFNR
jgi:hypothetical protein